MIKITALRNLLKKIIVCLLVFALAVPQSFSQPLSSQTLQNDLKYYKRISAQNKMDDNDKYYVLQRIYEKYKKSGVDLSPLKREMNNVNKSYETSDDVVVEQEQGKPVNQPEAIVETVSKPEVNVGKVEKVIVRETNEESLVVITATGITRKNDFIMRDPDPKKPVKIILDLYGVKENLKDIAKNIKLKSGMFTNIISSQFETNPLIVRISAELRTEKPYKITSDSNGCVISVAKDNDTVPKQSVPVPEKVKEEKTELPVVGMAKYGIDIGDVLSVNIYPAEELSREVVVQPDNNIIIPLIGPVKAKGITPEQLADNVEKSLSKYISNPKVSISVRKFSRRQVFITGETRGVGAYDYKENLRLMEFISSVGGFTIEANRREVKVYRGPANKRQTNVINVEEIIKTGDFSKDFLLEPGDIIEVTKGAQKISILGDVKSPGYYEYRDDLNLLEVVSLAGGFNETAKLSKVRIIRATDKPNERKVENVNLEKILAGERNDINIKAGDTIYIQKINLAKANWFVTTVMPWLSLFLLVFSVKSGVINW